MINTLTTIPHTAFPQVNNSGSRQAEPTAPKEENTDSDSKTAIHSEPGQPRKEGLVVATRKVHTANTKNKIESDLNQVLYLICMIGEILDSSGRTTQTRICHQN